MAQFPGQPRRYAEALLDTIDFLSEHQPRVAPVATGMDQNGDGQLAWNESQGPRGTFRKLDADADEIVTRDEIGTIIQ